MSRPIAERPSPARRLVELAAASLLLLAAAPAWAAHSLQLSTAPDRSSPVALDGATVDGDIHVFVLPESGVDRVIFRVDGARQQTENFAPFDLGGTATNGDALAYDSNQLADGSHTITASVRLDSGSTETVSASFTVANASPILAFDTSQVSLTAVAGGSTTSAQVALATSDAAADAFALSVAADPPWLSVDPASGQTPADITLTADPAATGAGTFTATLTATSTDGSHLAADLQVTLSVLATAAPDQVHLGWTGDPATSLNVVWRTLTPGVSSTAQYREQGASEWITVAGGPRVTEGAGTFHEAQLTGLAPSTEYEYRVRDNLDDWSATWSARTAPAAGEAGFDLVYFADTGLVGRTDGLATGTAQGIDEIAALDPTFTLPGGDYAYFDTDKRFGDLPATIDAWFNQVAPFARRVPMMPTYGNHETPQLDEDTDTWISRFPTPAGHDGRRHYSFDVGNVHFVSIFTGEGDSTTLSASTLTWLENDLAAASASGVDWIVPYMHIPSYSDGKNHPQNLPLRDQIAPLFEQYGVRLVLTSHDQSYERSYPLVDMGNTDTPTSASRSCYGPTDGTVWVKASPAGKLSNINGSFSPFRSSQTPEWTAVRDNTQHHFVRLSFNADDSLTVEAYGFEGDGTEPAVIDRFDYQTTACPLEPVATPANLDLTVVAGDTETAQLTLEMADGAAVSVELAPDVPWLAPSPTSGTTPLSFDVTADASSLLPGDYTGTVVVSVDGSEEFSIPVALSVTEEPQYTLQSSGSSSRTAPATLEGATLTGDAFVFVSPETDVSQARFYLDDPSASGSPRQTENVAPYDFAGTQSNDTAFPFDTTTVADGSHVITASITLDSGEVLQFSSNFVIDNSGGANAAPTASFGVACSDLSCNFDAGLSADSDGTIIDYAWSFGDGAAGSGVAPPHTYASGGTYSVSLTVTDDDGATATAVQEVTVSDPNQAPSATFSPSCAGLACDFDGTASSDSDGSIVQYDWDLGDGNSASGSIVSHGYAVPGTYLVTLTVSDDDGAAGTAVQQVTVSTSNTAPVADIAFACTDLGCDFDGSGSSDTDGSIVDYDWAFGDGGSASGSVVSHTYAAAGTYTVALSVTDDDGASSAAAVDVDVSAGNTAPTASFGFTCTGPECTFDASASTDIDGTIAAYDWDFGDGSLGSGVTASHTYSGSGSFDVTLGVVDNDGSADTTTRTVTVSSAAGCPAISPLDCNQIRQVGDLALEFDASAGGIVDGNGVGTGFTMVDPPSSPGNPNAGVSAPGLWAERVTVDAASGALRLQTTAGIRFNDNNDQDNALGVGLNVPSATVTIGTTLVDLAQPAPGGWAQAGLWFGRADEFGRGTAEDDNIKLVVASPAGGDYVVQAAFELAGEQVTADEISVPAGTSTVALELVVDPANRNVLARYDTGAGMTTFEVFSNVPDDWFSFDQAGIDPAVATRSYGGIFATHRRAGNSVQFAFDRFSVAEDEPLQGSGTFTFDEWEIPVGAPTALAWGPDDRLYVAEILGTIHAFTLDREARTVVDEEIIDAIPAAEGGGRLTLGLAIDPQSTPTDVSLWVGHSDGSINNGQENSGKISRISGPGFDVVEDRITGLPRSIANHAVNQIHFGPDGRLYIAAGGNTGAGAANLTGSEFGDRPEQPLSAALLVADVKAADFAGDCATPVGQFGIPSTCDVSVYASGLRNSYDFAWHSNGHLYATDNGLGVEGTVPPFTNPPCTGLADPDQDDPGSQSDLLLDIEPGKYYGHPNPYRDECVFKDGSFQGASPLPNYALPMVQLGDNLSANGIIDYRGDAFYSKLMGQLLIANFSVGDDIRQVQLSSDGTQVEALTTLVSGFSDPLPLAQDPQGHIYVGELNGNRVTVLDPLPLAPAPLGDWSTRALAPDEVLDAGGGSVGGRFYMVGGKNASGHVSSLYIYDPVADTWTTGAPLPGESVENPAVTSLDGMLYVFGGSTGPFSGAVADAWRYDPAADAWTALAPMGTARGGAVAAVVDGSILVAGGMDASGASLSSVEVYDPATGTWSAGSAMQTRRDNPGAAVLDGKLHVFGGRTRNADGSVISGTLASMEILDPASGLWSFGPVMPTGRRAMAIGSISGRAQVIGGESPVTAANEEYDPATGEWRILTTAPIGRHGAANATVNGAVHVIGGGPALGSSFTDAHAVFRY